ncbi:MAG: DUF4386 family protein [Sphingomonadales bacterium]|nr:DUF4386 family protein [Sphingomonadales bacterium]
MNGRLLGGSAAIALGIGFNIPYAVLAAIFEYPQILHRPADEILTRFAAGGAPLIIAWYGFMLAALALVPVATALAITPGRLRTMPALALGAALSGALAGLAQAIGLARWVFVVPILALEPGSSAGQAHLALLNAYGGVAVGENLGQLLTALFVGQMAEIQRQEEARRTAALGAATAMCIAIGTGEGPAIVLGIGGQSFGAMTIAGFAALSLWLLATGWLAIRHRSM